VPLPAARQPPTWRTSDSNVPNPANRRPPRLKRRERTPAAGGETMGEKFQRILPKVAISSCLYKTIYRS